MSYLIPILTLPHLCDQNVVNIYHFSHATYSAHFPFIKVIALTISGEERKLRNSCVIIIIIITTTTTTTTTTTG